MSEPTMKDRAMGAVIGTLIGDALGLGPHWYYDLEELQRDYGPWIDGYVPPKPGRYHAGLPAGEVSQTGQVAGLLLASLAERCRYEEADFTWRLDTLLDTLDGTPQGGRYTDHAMRDVWQGRKTGRPWGDVGSFADTAEAAIRAPVLAAALADDPKTLIEALFANLQLTHRDPFILGQSVAFGLIVCALIRGAPPPQVSRVISGWTRQFGLHFEHPLAWQGRSGALVTSDGGFFDALLQPGWAWEAAHDQAIGIEPAQAVCRLFGLACTLGFMLPAAYYLVARYPDNFGMAVLSAVNGGGNNMARAALTGALSGAMVGLPGIPQRLVNGLLGHETYLDQADRISGKFSS
jgi:ADP-ribosylglycohydrolase